MDCSESDSESDTDGSTAESSGTVSDESDSSSEAESIGDDPKDPTYVPSPVRQRALRNPQPRSARAASPSAAKPAPTSRRRADANPPPQCALAASPSGTAVAAQQQVTHRNRTKRHQQQHNAASVPAAKRPRLANLTSVAGIPPLPANFGWTKCAPPSKRRYVHPKRPLRSHVFQTSDSPSNIFFRLYKPAYDVWLSGTNESGATLYGPKWKPVSYAEGLRFKSIRIYMNAVVVGNVENYWENCEGALMEFITQQMSKARYLQIRRASKCSIPSETEAAGASIKGGPNYDPINKVSPMINALNVSFRECRGPDDYMALDEAMIKCQARCPFLVSMPNKPIDFGIKLFVLAESRTGYVHSFVMYHRGMHNNDEEHFGVTNSLVLDILNGSKFSDGVSFLNQGFTIVTDNYYGDVYLAHVLKTCDTHIVSTMRGNRRYLPKDDLYTFRGNAKNVKIVTPHGTVAKRGHSTFRHSRCGTMTVAAWQDNKTVLVLSTDPNYRTEMCMVNRRNKLRRDTRHSIQIPQPMIVHLYTSKMAGVDLGDQRIASDHKHRRSRRWYMQVLDQGIEMTILNCGVILRERPNGKQIWTAYRIKLAICQGLREMADSIDPSSKVAPLSLRLRRLPKKRLDVTLEHYPVQMTRAERSRTACVAHKQRRQPNTKCAVCEVALCVDNGECWRRFHYDIDYLYDDPSKQDKPIYHRCSTY